MKSAKKFIKSLIIYFIVFMMLLSNVCYGGYTQEEVGDAIAGYAAHIVTEYGDQVEYGQIYGMGYNVDRTWNPIWSPESYSWDDTSTYGFDCSSFSSGCIHAVTGLLSSALSTYGLAGLGSDSNFDVFDYTGRDCLMPGDVVVHNDGAAHAVVYVGQVYEAWDTSGEIANNGSTFRSISYFDENYNFKVVRVSESGAASLTSLNTEFSNGTIKASSSKIPLSDFYFNGVPDGKYSVASTNIFEAIITTLADVADYLVGILTYGIRIVIVGCTALVDQLINNTADGLLGANIDVDTEQDTGISSVEIDSANNENRLTIESLVFNTYPPLNVNIFKTEDEAK